MSTRVFLKKDDLFFREASPDRPLLSANDWWGAGFLEGIGAGIIRAKRTVRWYCGKGGAYEQYKRGLNAGWEAIGAS